MTFPTYNGFTALATANGTVAYGYSGMSHSACVTHNEMYVPSDDVRAKGIVRWEEKHVRTVEEAIEKYKEHPTTFIRTRMFFGFDAQGRYAGTVYERSSGRRGELSYEYCYADDRHTPCGSGYERTLEDAKKGLEYKYKRGVVTTFDADKVFWN